MNEPKVTIGGAGAASAGDTPSQAVVKAANQTVQVTDSAGRVIAIRKPGILQRLRLFELIGGENAKNEMYLGFVSLAAHVASIDGEPVPFPVSKRELEALVARLDDHGLNAVAAAAAEHFSGSLDEEAKERIKNSLGTLG